MKAQQEDWVATVKDLLIRSHWLTRQASVAQVPMLGSFLRPLRPLSPLRPILPVSQPAPSPGSPQRKVDSGESLPTFWIHLSSTIFTNADHLVRAAQSRQPDVLTSNEARSCSRGIAHALSPDYLQMGRWTSLQVETVTRSRLGPHSHTEVGVRGRGDKEKRLEAC